jgi:hypothetical protein
MLYDPADHYTPEETTQEFNKQSKLWERFMKIKQSRLLSFFKRKESSGSSGKPKSLFHYFFHL